MNSNRRGTLILIFVLLAIGIGGIFFGVIYPRLSTPYENTLSVQLPTIQVSLVSDSDGKKYDVQTDFTLEMDWKIQGRVSSRELQGYISEIMATLEYDRITSSGSIEYIQSQVEQHLADYLGEDVLNGLYITSITTGEGLTPPPTQNKIYDNLFPNSK